MAGRRPCLAGQKSQNMMLSQRKAVGDKIGGETGYDVESKNATASYGGEGNTACPVLWGGRGLIRERQPVEVRQDFEGHLQSLREGT
jgi:hypothetical protein